mgnify:CR=1 FL=1
MSKLGKDRGASYEREVSKTLSERLGTKVTRVLGQARDGGSDIDLGPFMIECKRRRKIALYEWMEQAIVSADGKKIPVVVCRGDGKKSLAVFLLDDAITLMQNEL